MHKTHHSARDTDEPREPQESADPRRWKALALDGYAPRSRSKPEMLQGALFSYLEAP